MDHLTKTSTKNKPLREDFGKLADQYRPQLTSFLYRFITSREDAEDITQETFIKAYLKLESFEGDSTFKTWLFSIAANIARDHLRAKHRWAIDAQDKCKELVGSTPALAAELHKINYMSAHGSYEIKEHIDFCFTCIMKTLSLEQQLSLMLADIYDFKIKEIAEILGATAGVVKHYLYKARTTMQQVFEQRCSLINKKGTCHQCSELNGFNNSKAETQRAIAGMELSKAAQNADKQHLFRMRTEMIKSIDPLNARGTDLHDFLLKCTHNANDTN